MTVYILGAGASANAGYPLASKLLQGVSDWLDHCGRSDPWIGEYRNRVLQVRETFGSLDDFEGILGRLDEYGYRRVPPTSKATYRQNHHDISHDCAEVMRGRRNPDEPALGFYPQYMRSELIMALHEMFYDSEQKRSTPTAYDSFAERIMADSAVITFNYDVALERALARTGKWDVGTGYGYTFVPNRAGSLTMIYKLHGSVNWLKTPMQENPPPYIRSRDLKLLGYDSLVDPRIGENDIPVAAQQALILQEPRKKFVWERFWSPLWSGAAQRLRGANEIFIHGYSMPVADSHARQLLFDNINKDAAVNIYCRSHSDRIAEEFRGRGFAGVTSFPATEFETWVASP
jgi:hypothetical protein